MFLLASAVVFLGRQAQRCSAAIPDRGSVALVHQPAFLLSPGLGKAPEAVAANRGCYQDAFGMAGASWRFRCDLDDG